MEAVWTCARAHTHACIYVHLEMHTYACICSGLCGIAFLHYSSSPSLPLFLMEKNNSAELEPHLKLKIAGRNINDLRYANNTTLTAESEELKSLLMKSERGEWKSWLKAQHSENEDHGIWSHHFTANRWGNNGNSERLYFGGLQNHCRWWPRPWNLKMLAPWKKSYDQPR